MRKVIFSSIVVVLAGTCWVLAQNAASKPVVPPYGGRKPATFPVEIPAMLPAEKAEMLTIPPGESLVAPTTELQAPNLGPSAVAPAIPVPPPPAVEQSPQRPALEPAPRRIELLPTPMPMLAAPPLPAPNLKPPTIAPTRPALPGLPPLPPIPGVSTSVLIPGNNARVDYEGIVIPQPAKALNSPSGPVWNGVPSGPDATLQPDSAIPSATQVDPPDYWRDRHRIFDGGNACAERTPGPRFWGGAEFLTWRVQPQSSPALAQAVASDDPSQSLVLYPYPGLEYSPLPGVRGTLGFWLNSNQTFGLEANYMWFGDADTRDGFHSNFRSTLGRPFVSATTGFDSFYQVSSPGTVDGMIGVGSNYHLDGGEANFLFNSMRLSNRFNLLAGFRYLNMTEDLRIGHLSETTDSISQSYDQFSTRNQFWGGQVGLRWNYLGRRLTASLTGKIAFGAMIEEVNIEGATMLSTIRATTISPGGLLTQASNIGSYIRSRPAFVPEAAANLGYRLAPWATVNIGYNLLYATEVVRPGRQIDNVVDINNQGGTGRPSFSFKSADFWVQGLNVALTFQY